MERGGRNDPRKLERRVSPRVDLPAMATNPSHRRGIERPRSEIPRGGDGRSDEATAPADWAGIAGESTPVERRIAHDASRCVDERSDRSEFRPVLPVRPFGCPGRDRAAGAKDRVSSLGTRDPRDTRSRTKSPSLNQNDEALVARTAVRCRRAGTVARRARTWQDEQRGARNRADRRARGGLVENGLLAGTSRRHDVDEGIGASGAGLKFWKRPAGARRGNGASR